MGYSRGYSRLVSLHAISRLKGVEGTLWAAYNGVTEWLDHRKIRQSADQRLASIWFGEANRIKARALTVAVEMLSHFRN